MNIMDIMHFHNNRGNITSHNSYSNYSNVYGRLAVGTNIYPAQLKVDGECFIHGILKAFRFLVEFKIIMDMLLLALKIRVIVILQLLIEVVFISIKKMYVNGDIYRYGTNTFNIGVNGNKDITIKSNGLVGIDEENPNAF